MRGVVGNDDGVGCVKRQGKERTVRHLTLLISAECQQRLSDTQFPYISPSFCYRITEFRTDKFLMDSQITFLCFSLRKQKLQGTSVACSVVYKLFTHFYSPIWGRRLSHSLHSFRLLFTLSRKTRCLYSNV
jgi:hypothetical protein